MLCEVNKAVVVVKLSTIKSHEAQDKVLFFKPNIRFSFRQKANIETTECCQNIPYISGILGHHNFESLSLYKLC